MHSRTRSPIKIIFFLAIFLCLATAIQTTEAQKLKAGNFELLSFEMPDVERGAGLAIYLRTPGGKTYLYDTGLGYPDKTSPSGWGKDFNAGRDIIAPYLKRHGVKQIDGVFLSHAHYDHFGGLMWLVDNFPIKKLYDSGFVFKTDGEYGIELDDYYKIRARFKQKPGAYQECHTGDKLSVDTDLEVEVISPPKNFFSEKRPETRPKQDPPAHYLVNANSLGLRIRHGQTVFLLPGDIQREDQLQSLLPSLPPEKFKCDVLIAPGHGIHSIPEFAQATRPSLTIASAFNRFALKSPAPEIFGAVGSKVYLTGIHGNIQVISDGQSYTIKVEREKAQ